jgi:hypothetical protein
MTNNHYDAGPVTDVNNINIRCYNSQNLQSATTANITAGSNVGFKISTIIGHPGVRCISLSVWCERGWLMMGLLTAADGVYG